MSDTLKTEIREGQEIAIRFKDNWDGEGDIYLCIAYKANGELLHKETGEKVLMHVGDKIIEWWPLTVGSGLTFSEPDEDESYKCESCELEECDGGCDK